MAIKYFMPGRSDNGNEFLCLNCERASRRSGTLSQDEIFCASSSFSPQGDSPVPFRVTQCSEYIPDELRPRGRVLAALEAEAFFLIASVEGRGFTFVDAAEYARRRANGTVES